MGTSPAVGKAYAQNVHKPKFDIKELTLQGMSAKPDSDCA